MSTISEIMGSLKTVIEMNTKVTSVGHTVEKLTNDFRDLDKRVVRIETIIEITRPDGGTLKIGGPGANGS